MKQGDSQVEDVDIIVDDPNPDIIDIDSNPKIVDGDQLCFGTKSLNVFYCNILKNI